MGSTTVTVLEKVTQTVDIVLPGPQGPVGDVNPQMFTLRDAAQTAATSAQSSATSASGSAATATTQATRSADWAEKTVGTVDGVGYSSKYHAQLASTSAQTATTKASEASASATSASGSASTASTKASEASTSATNAAASATAAATSATDTANALVGERSAVATLTNKTLALGGNTITGTTAQFNTALTDGDFATLAGTETLTNKTITGGTTNPTTLQEGGVDAVIQSDIGTEPNQIPLNQYLGPLAYRDENPAGAVVGTTAVQVLSGKSFSDNVGFGTSSPANKLHVLGTGTLAQFSNGVDANLNIKTATSLMTVGTGVAGSSLALMTGDTERLRIDASGNLGLGVTPSAWGGVVAFQIAPSGVLSGNNGAAGALDLGRNFYFDGSTFRYIFSGPGNASTLYEQSASGSHAWLTAPSGTAGDPITFTQAMMLDASGYLRLASGGIQFNGDTAAANALDDYEEGTFTPTIVGATTAGVGTYTSQIGRYTKVGNRVHYSIVLDWTAHTGVGTLGIAGLPFTSSAVANNQHVAAVFHSNLSYTAGNQVSAIINTGTTTLLIRQSSAGAAATTIDIDTAASFYVSGHYEV